MTYPDKIRKIHIDVIGVDAKSSYKVSENSKKVNIRVPWRDNWRHTWISALHELIELGIMFEQDVEPSEIEEFERKYGKHGDIGEEPLSPTFQAHHFSNNALKHTALKLGVKWEEYQA